MIFGVYSIRDSLSGFMNPTFEVNDAVAMRNFEHAVLSSDTLLHSHAKDYDLIKIGSFNSESGEVLPLVPFVTVVTGMSIIVSSLSNKE